VRIRLMVAMLLLAAGTVVVAAVGAVVLIRHSTISSARNQLYQEARAVADVKRGNLALLSQLSKVEPVGQYDSLKLVGLSPDGRLTGRVPRAVAGLHLNTAPLSRGDAVIGSSGRMAYVLIPLHLTARQRGHIVHRVPLGDQPVLVATRNAQTPTAGVGWFALLALASLAFAGLVAYALANRFARPLTIAARVTEQIAGGDLEARMPPSGTDMAEFASLAAAINAMGEALERARYQQRQFLLSVSHDLRTPLTSIRGYAEAIAEGAATDTQGAATVIVAEARRLERLVQDLLDLARLDARRFSFQPALVDMADAVPAAVDTFRHGGTGDVELVELVPPPGALVVWADPDRLGQLLSNLLENACRFARSRVTVSARSEGTQVVVSVDDDGAGIDPDDLPRVFEPHFTSDLGRPDAPGTGLGLAIVAELAAAMGGRAEAVSPIGPQSGTRMRVTLPAAGPPTPAPLPPGGPPVGAALQTSGSSANDASTGLEGDPAGSSATGPGTARDRWA
jgi:two-component system sensor histidine kinase BaeS